MSIQTQIRQNGTLCDVYRQTVAAGSKKRSTKIGSERVFIAPMSATAANIAQMAFAQAFSGYAMAATIIHKGDYLQTAVGDKYDVQGDRNYMMGHNPLVELTLQRQSLQGQI